MHVRQIYQEHREEWNALATQEPHFALLQSWEWGEFKQNLGWKPFRIAVFQQTQIIVGAQMLIKPLPSGFASVAYIPHGPMGVWTQEEAISLLFAELHRVAKKHKAIFLKIEPAIPDDPRIHQFLQNSHFHPSSFTNQPRATIIIDLTRDLDEIMRQTSQKTRQYIRKADRDGVTVRRGGDEDLEAFYSLMRITAKRNKFPPRVRAYYESQWKTLSKNERAILLMAYRGEEVLAVRTAYCFGNHAAEFHAGSIDILENLRPNHLLVWEAIKWAKEQGCKTYDLWGIPDEVGMASIQGFKLPTSDRKDGLWGAYRFKSGFSKNIVNYIGAYDHVYKPLLYKSVTNKFLNPKTFDRITKWMDLSKNA